MRFRKVLGLGLAAAVSVVGLAYGGPAGQAQAAKSSIHVTHNASAVHARAKGKKGAIDPTYVVCGSDQHDPSYYKIQIKKGSKVVASGRHQDRGYRVKAGRYKVVTTVACGTERKVITKKVRVKTFKDKDTVSRGEYKKIHKGTTRKKAEKIVGGKFNACEDGVCVIYSTVWDYEVELDFVKGKVVDKAWYFEPYFA